MDLNLILLILYLAGFFFTLWFFFFRDVGCIKNSFHIALIYGVLWFIILPFGLIVVYLDAKKQKKVKRK